jgi:hypothetical protein
MKLIAYQTDDTIKELMKLCIKILKTKKFCTIVTKDIEAAEQLSNYFWKSHIFLPHCIRGEAFEAIQPVLISDTASSRPVLINFEGIWIRYEGLQKETYILWNTEPDSPNFMVYRHDENGKWAVLSK